MLCQDSTAHATTYPELFMQMLPMHRHAWMTHMVSHTVAEFAAMWEAGTLQ